MTHLQIHLHIGSCNEGDIIHIRSISAFTGRVLRFWKREGKQMADSKKVLEAIMAIGRKMEGEKVRGLCLCVVKGRRKRNI